MLTYIQLIQDLFLLFDFISIRFQIKLHDAVTWHLMGQNIELGFDFGHFSMDQFILILALSDLLMQFFVLLLSLRLQLLNALYFLLDSFFKLLIELSSCIYCLLQLILKMITIIAHHVFNHKLLKRINCQILLTMVVPLHLYFFTFKFPLDFRYLLKQLFTRLLIL